MITQTKDQYISPECEVLEMSTEGGVMGWGDIILSSGEIVE